MTKQAESPPTEYGQGLRRYGRARVALLPALGLSILLHSVGIFTIRFPLLPRAEDLAPPPPLLFMPLEDIVQPREVAIAPPGPGGPAPDVIIRGRGNAPSAISLPTPVPGSMPGAVSVGDGGSTEDPTPLQRLEYRRTEVDVWKPPPAVPLEVVAPDAVVRQRVAERLAALNDSSAAAAAAAARATDWTVRDGEGGRWGVSPGKIHLGDVTLPLPFAFSAPAGRRDEIAGRMRTWQETQAQAVRAEGAEVFDSRVKAIREKADQERRRRMAADTARSGN